uniref:Uncharacterized protein n=1 Tax=Lactuca sativa TaxID=4236 RepID=A0A9R1W9P1_LACSA|nr:hypothetical protein LSAT_V11C200058450 [Lactuca sativa]
MRDIQHRCVENIIKTRNCLTNFNIDPKEIVSWNSIDCYWVSDFVRKGQSHSRYCVSFGGPNGAESHQALEVRGVQIPSINCGYCLNGVKSADHKCEFAVIVRNWIMNWCGINPGGIDNLDTLLHIVANWS